MLRFKSELLDVSSSAHRLFWNKSKFSSTQLASGLFTPLSVTIEPEDIPLLELKNSTFLTSVDTNETSFFNLSSYTISSIIWPIFLVFSSVPKHFIFVPLELHFCIIGLSSMSMAKFFKIFEDSTFCGNLRCVTFKLYFFEMYRLISSSVALSFSSSNPSAVNSIMPFVHT
eukprot:NODE_104_length_19294_cov_0.449179.p17 type:complete len:171 gc:universal NODE_104_length_19294_cov_0.449179:3550-4062(+)